MTDDRVEQELSAIFADRAGEAACTPVDVGWLRAGAVARARKQRARQAMALSGGGVLAVGALVGMLALPGAPGLPAPSDGHGMARRTSGSSPLAAGPSQAPSLSTVMDGPTYLSPGGAGLGSCVVGYSPAAVSTYTRFAFDGTVTGVSAVDGPGIPSWRASWMRVEFQVHQWYRGGQAPTVVVTMPPSATGVPQEFDELGGLTYDVGTRLLVSGNPLRGGADPLKDALAWTGCGGFTRPWTLAEATLWERATR